MLLPKKKHSFPRPFSVHAGGIPQDLLMELQGSR